MRNRTFILLIVTLVLANVLAQVCFFRLDLTDDKRYSLSEATQQLMERLDNDVNITLYLAGDLNAGFLRLQHATEESLSEFAQYGNVHYTTVDPLSLTEADQQQLQDALAQQGLQPTVIYEKAQQGSQKQTIVYPFAYVTYHGKGMFVRLLQNNRGLSGAENLNHSIESLEYVFCEAIRTLSTPEKGKIAFLEGHNELPEEQTIDVQMALAQYFDIYRGTITHEANCLDDFQAVVVADPQKPFTDQDKYVLDQYIMRGGRILWLVNGVDFSQTMLTEATYTPLIPLDLKLTDLFFRYGVRINSRLVQDMQCLPIPVDVSSDPQQPQYQPMPWVNAPLLLTSSASPITRNVMQVSATFASDIDLVGANDSLQTTVLLATSNASRLVPTPNEVNLTDLHIDPQHFTQAFVPIAVSVAGSFPSLFTHRMIPEHIITDKGTVALSQPTKQVFVSCGSIIRNEWQNGQPLPAGYDRYSKVQFGNRDFIVNALLYLTDDDGFINLRQKSIPLRMLRTDYQSSIIQYQLISILLPLVLLAIVGASIMLIRKKKYTQL